MRLSTIASIGVLAASTAALAQVASAPVEQKVPVAGQATSNDTAGPDAARITPANAAAANTIAPAGNDLAPALPPTEQKAPRRQR